ncbi:MAG: alkaline phosphatase family protein [Acidobacteria bacterium]|nr:alkaline phosphatase family protein [Acidobacteriota bacterium]
MRRLVLVVLLVSACAAASRAFQTTGGAAQPQPTVILLSIDGWRWDYDTRAPAPNLRSLMARGVRAENLIPSFPSKTFPNHYTIVTGLYPGHHGIVANAIKDPATGRLFAMSRTAEVRDPMWWGGEPIWVTAQRAGQSAAAMFWPGSEAPIHGMLPRYWKAYDEDYPPADRVDQVLAWLDLPAERRPTLVTLYFSDVDGAGHRGGPDSSDVRDAIVRVDGYVGRLLRGLERRGLQDAVNLVVVSDHGMANVSRDRVVVLDDYVSLDDDEVVDINPTLGVVPSAGREEPVFRALANAHPRLTVYRRAETPLQWRYRDHPRIPPIVGVMDEGWQIVRRGTAAAVAAGRLRPPGGQHGYDPALMSMRGIFVAAGPAFRTGATVPAFENVQIYNVLAQVLHVTPAANDGGTDVARMLLKQRD